MSLQVLVSNEAGRIPLSAVRVGDIARLVLRSERVRDAMLSITFLGRRAMRRLNAEHLGHDRDTDVLAFGFRPAGEGAPEPAVGDVYIAPDVARENAAAFGSGVREELARLVVHGTLHVLGYDHPDGDARTASPMWERQERLVARARRLGA